MAALDPLRPPLQPRAKSTMKRKDYLAAIAKLDLSQQRAARFLGIGDRTSSAMALGETSVPRVIELLFKVMIKHGITPGDLDAAFK